MAQKIVECIANYSEGRRTEVVDAIVEAISAVSGVYVLDRQSDSDHNRSVVTFAGAPQSVLEAAFASIAKAAELIDMDEQRGEHPRLGATDVVPFVPLQEMTMDECVALARALGKRVGEELGIPAYLYEAAATRADRVNLEDIRRGEYEVLKMSIDSDPYRTPDFGPRRVGKAGATIIGARAPLIAFNVYLTTDDIGIAKKVAAAVRQSSGGLRFVKGLGLLVEGRAQVSMNLTDFTKTPVARVVEMIRREAQRYGVAIHHSELVGLIPQAALSDAAQWYLQLDRFKPSQILETRLHAALSEDRTGDTAFLEQLAAGTATPGGGSAAAYAGAMGAGLVGMVARLSIGKKKYAEVEARMREIAAEADALRAALQKAVTQDAQAFDAVMEAMRLPKDTETEQKARAEALERATHGAAAVPLHVAKSAAKVLELAAEAAETGNTNAITDAASAGAMARAALQAATLNVKTNALSVKEGTAADAWLQRLAEIESAAQAAEARLRAALKNRANIE
ncbi:MAG: glutamate formimidoyltransferase [Chloroflexi bacterium]|nr:glutamate formimidoyltransferase [Chloroflexota bacterium]